ncbi:MAG: glycosyltransferase family 4 protein [Synergistaceae bacterium]|nr:glycosyltransferase family 4 protein [Synergistaceae bacterium]
MWRFFQAKFASPEGGAGSVYHPTYYNFSSTAHSKVVFTVHDFTHERYPLLFTKSDKTPELKREAFERADALICVSESTKNDLLNFYELKPKCLVKTIYHGYNDLSSFSTLDKPLPAYPYFLFVGPRHKYKNFGCLLEAFSLSSSLKKDFGIVCFGGTAFSDTEKKRFAELGIADRVARFEGGDDMLAALYKNAAALVFPSLYEGFGIPVLEAMSCDCPVIAGDTSSIPEVAGDAALLFNPASAENLADQLKKVAFDGELRTNMIESGRRRRSLFSWDRCAKETLALYKELLQ